MLKLLTLTFALFIVFSMESKAQYGEIFSPDCKLYIPIIKDKKIDRLMDVAVEKLKERGFLVEEKDFTKNFTPLEHYFTLEQKLDGGGFYPPCLVKVKIAQIAKALPSEKDKTLYEYTAKRSHPRVTRDGYGRCKMAARDAFAFFPICSKQAPSIK